MKRYLILIMMIIGLIHVNADGFYSYGGMSYLGNYYNRPFTTQTKDANWFEADIAVGLEKQWENIRLFAEVELNTIMFHISETHTFSPQIQDYFVRAGVELGIIGISYEHLCKHTIDDYVFTNNQGYDKILISFDTRRLRKEK
jgi:hypothetical protein